MSPDEIQKQTEHSIQSAIFCWANKAERVGFRAAMDMRCYHNQDVLSEYELLPVPELHWLHAIPNGGLRNKPEALKLKAEGVKPGILDICLPIPRHCAHGLYIECKKPKEQLSANQKLFAQHLIDNGYMWTMVTNWRDAADYLQWYLSK